MTLEDIRDKDGNLPAYAWPGGYPLYYVTRDGMAVCPECANREIDQAQEPIDVGTHWEGDPLQCDDCSTMIESAYGPIDEDET
jgi:hypothetical protein